MSYYDDLSVGSSGNQESSHSESDNDDQEWLVQSTDGRRRGKMETKFTDLPLGLWDRCILHLDVDCFYCQCEEIDRCLRNEPRPLAIGQKHIVVTANYEARKYGVQKLQSREAAYLACPHLWIVEGSDLIHYRRHSRAIYEAFRQSLQEIAEEVGCSRIPAKKGCMDEMMADLTAPVQCILQKSNLTSTLHKQRQSHPEQVRFVFGDDASSCMTVLVEDQTGQKSVVSFQQSTATTPENSLTSSRQNIHDTCGASDQDRQECQLRLGIASDLAERVCHYICQRTGFYTTSGISVSPLLAKLASGLNKPKSINLLYPWRSSQLLYAMPLRKMHKIGSCTMKALEKEMTSISDEVALLLPNSDVVEASPSSKDRSKMRTVRDLLEMPRSSIRKAVQGMVAFQAKAASDEQCDLLIQQCRGLDTSEIVDDEGGLPKTVSVENSFRRGTVKSMEAVNQALEDLYTRLPLLLQDRISWAADPQTAYPVTIRLTIRNVDPQLSVTKRRRPYVTRSKQSSIDGKLYLLQEKDFQTRVNTIRRHSIPLLRQLLSSSIDVTRINIALSNFQDVALAQQTALKTTTGHSTLAETLERKRNLAKSSSLPSWEKEYSDVKFEKRAKLAILYNSTTNTLSRPDTDAVKSRQQNRLSNKEGKMKSTRIDQFFVKK